MPGGAERVAPGQPPRGEPSTPYGAVRGDGCCGVIRTRRQKATRATKIRRKEDFIGANCRQQRPRGRRRVKRTASVECVARECFGTQLQGCSGWRRAARVWGRRPRRNRARSCCDGKPLESVVWLDFSEPPHRASCWPPRRVALPRADWPAGTGWRIGCGRARRGRTRA